MTIMLATGDGEARTLFGEQDIGDTDGDGAPEFLDGWGRPIHFLRWPAGFAEAGLSSLMSTNADLDHDPLDYFRLQNPPAGDNAGYRLMPLIVSAGPDGILDIFMAEKAVLANPYVSYTSKGIDAKIGTPLSPNNPPYGVGSADNDDGNNWIDNIHNHLQDNQ